MEKEITQDFSITRPIFHIFTALVVLLPLVVFLSPPYSTKPWHELFIACGVTIGAICLVQFGYRSAVVRLHTSPDKWLLTDDGLVRLYGSGARETIRWDQIRDMRWSRYLGAKIRWENADEGHLFREFRNEFRKPQTGRYWCWIRVREADARAIFQSAKKEWIGKLVS